MYQIKHYCAEDGRDGFGDWLDALQDRSARARIETRIDRLALGLFGDMKTLRDGVCELRIDTGPGYRVYYAFAGRALILLLCGGDKRSQRRDISRAVNYWRDFKKADNESHSEP